MILAHISKVMYLIASIAPTISIAVVVEGVLDITGLRHHVMLQALHYPSWVSDVLVAWHGWLGWL